MVDHTIAPEDAEVFAQFPHTLKKYLCYRPEQVLATFIVEGSGHIDTENLSIYAIDVRDASEDDIDVENETVGYLVKIGTTPGAMDVGIFRVRTAAGFSSGSGTLYVNETAYADVPVQDGMYGTIIRDHRVWERKIRRVLVGDIDYDEYIDYDEVYINQNEEPPPIANVTKNAAGDPVEHFGFLDPGETYRTVLLSSLLSFNPYQPEDSIDVTWRFVDCEGSFGPTSHDAEIEYHMPAGFCECKLVVSSSGKTVVRYIPLWTFTGPDDPLLITDFSVTKDSRGEGREMSFNIGRKADQIPELPMIGYFEVADFGGDAPPHQYIHQFIGWTLSDGVPLNMRRSRYSMVVGGPKSWLDRISIGAQTIYDPRTMEDPDGISLKFIELPRASPDKMVHYFLRTNSTALEVMNMFFSDYDVPIEGYTSNEGSIWQQLVDITERYFGICACDSLGALFLTRHFSYLQQDERDEIDPILTVDKSFWRDNESPEVTEEKVEKVGLVDVYGSNYDVVFSPYADSSHIFRVWAPGIVPGKGAGKENPSSRFLMPGADAELQLRRLAGHHLARKNNPRSDITLPLKGNYDFIEPAWGIPIALTYTDDNARGYELVESPFLVKSVEVQHSNTGLLKRVTWGLEQVTYGYPGIAIDVTQRVDIEPYPFPEGTGGKSLRSGTKAIGTITQGVGGAKLQFIYDIDTDTPSLVTVSINSYLEEFDTVSDFEEDAYCPYCMGTGSEINLWMVTSMGYIYKLVDVVGDLDVQLQFAPETPTFPSFNMIKTERGVQNWVVAIIGGSSSGDTNYSVVTTDGENWTAYELPFAASAHVQAIHVSPKIPGLVYVNYFPVSGITGATNLYKSTDYGAAYSITTDTHIIIRADGMHVPFQSSDDKDLFSWSTDHESERMIYSNNGSDTTIVPDLGLSQIFGGKWSLKTCDVNSDIVLAVAIDDGGLGGENGAAYYSEDGGATWTDLSHTDKIDFSPGGCNIAGDSGSVLFLWGNNYFGWTDDPYDDIHDRSAGISGNLLNIFGIPNTPP